MGSVLRGIGKAGKRQCLQGIPRSTEIAIEARLQIPSDTCNVYTSADALTMLLCVVNVVAGPFRCWVSAGLLRGWSNHESGPGSFHS